MDAIREKYGKIFSSSLRLKACLKYIDLIVETTGKTLFISIDENKFKRMKKEETVLQKYFKCFSIELLRINNFQNTPELKQEIKEVLNGEVLICRK